MYEVVLLYDKQSQVMNQYLPVLRSYIFYFFSVFNLVDHKVILQSDTWFRCSQQYENATNSMLRIKIKHVLLRSKIWEGDIYAGLVLLSYFGNPGC